MEISKIKLAWKYLTGGVGNVVDYLLDVLSNALQSLNDTTKAKMYGVLNCAEKVLATLMALKWLCPTKWQTAYAKTITAVDVVVVSLEDLNITREEFDKILGEFNSAVAAWKGEDDETCVA